MSCPYLTEGSSDFWCELASRRVSIGRGNSYCQGGSSYEHCEYYSDDDDCREDEYDD